MAGRLSPDRHTSCNNNSSAKLSVEKEHLTQDIRTRGYRIFIMGDGYNEIRIRGHRILATKTRSLLMRLARSCLRTLHPQAM